MTTNVSLSKEYLDKHDWAIQKEKYGFSYIFFVLFKVENILFFSRRWGLRNAYDDESRR